MIFTSRKMTLALLGAYAVLLAIATFIEKAGTMELTRKAIYNHPCFYLLPLMMVVHFGVLAWHQHLWRQRNYGIGMLHGSFIVILTGAFITHLFGFEGVVHLREGETVSSIQTMEGQRPLPFTIRLDDFKLTRYPGSHSPSSYESFLTLRTDNEERSVLVSMNKVIHEQGYRIYQSSYTPDEQGTVLSMNHDSIGTGVTYVGYLLLLVGILLILTDPKSRFRQLGKRLKLLAPMFALVCLPLEISAQEQGAEELLQHTIPAAQAERWGRMQLQSPAGRVEPMNTYTSQLLRKIYRSDTFEGLRSEQIIIGFLLDAEYWGNITLIRQPNRALQQSLSLPEGKYLRFFDFFDRDGRYLLADAVEKAYSRPVAERSSVEKDLLKLDEKVNILYSLRQKQQPAFLSLVGAESEKMFSQYLNVASDALRTGDWKPADELLTLIDDAQQRQQILPLLTEKQVSWELFYNRAHLFYGAAMGYMVTGFLLFLLVMTNLWKPKHWMKGAIVSLLASVILVFLLHTLGLGIRWYLSERAPWSNGYESMVYIAWATTLAGLLFMKRSFLTLALAAVFAGIILWVAHLNLMDPEITPLVPVLKSYWLMIHVAVITASYGFFGISFLLGLLTLAFMAVRHPSKVLLLRPQIEGLRIINEMSLHMGLYLLTVGIFLGAIWANESWGRYWGWDPKETWALITMLLYAFILHARFVPALRSDYAFSVMSVCGFASVLMTYLGVNYYLLGLHSYGSGDTPLGLHAFLIASAGALALIIYVGCKRSKVIR